MNTRLNVPDPGVTAFRLRADPVVVPDHVTMMWVPELTNVLVMVNVWSADAAIETLLNVTNP